MCLEGRIFLTLVTMQSALKVIPVLSVFSCHKCHIFFCKCPQTSAGATCPFSIQMPLLHWLLFPLLGSPLLPPTLQDEEYIPPLCPHVTIDDDSLSHWLQYPWNIFWRKKRQTTSSGRYHNSFGSNSGTGIVFGCNPSNEGFFSCCFFWQRISWSKVTYTFQK